MFYRSWAKEDFMVDTSSTTSIQTKQPVLTSECTSDISAVLDITALRALADETRLTIISTLASKGELCACKLLDHLNVSQSTLSHHMKVLIDAGLITQRKEGRWSHYQLNTDSIRRLGDSIAALGSRENG